MSKVGAELKRSREAQDKTRAEVSRDTGILIHHLAALEHGNFVDLPDDETVAGFVKTYAEYLGFVADEPVAEFRAERAAARLAAAGPPTPADTVTEGAQTPTARRWWPWIAAGGAVIVALVSVGLLRDTDRAPASDRRDAAPASDAVAASPPETTPSLETAEPARVESPAGAPAAAATAPPAPRSEPGPRLAVVEHGVGTGVENRRLVGRSARFPRGAEVWFWTRVEGGRPGDEIRHVWIHRGREVGAVALAVGSADWRTHSVKTMFDGSAGRWAVEARDAAGRVLARDEFDCDP